MKKLIILTFEQIGHKEKQIQDACDFYSRDGNEEGYFLRCENCYTPFNRGGYFKGVQITTNCFDSEEDLKDYLLTTLLFKL